MSNEYVSASAKFLSESYARDNAGYKDYQDENTAYLVGIYEATKELLTDIISESEEIDYELSEEIADELIYNEEVFDYIDDLINEEILSEDVYIVPFSSFSVYLEETQNVFRENILSESLYGDTLDEGVAKGLLKGAEVVSNLLRGISDAGGFRGVAKAAASKTFNATKSVIGGARDAAVRQGMRAQSALDTAGKRTGEAIRRAGKQTIVGTRMAYDAARTGASAAGRGAIQGVGYGVEKARQGAAAARSGAVAAGKGAIQGVGYGVEKARQGASSARSALSGLKRSGIETLGKLRQAGAEKIKQGQELASNIRQAAAQKLSAARQGVAQKASEVRQGVAQKASDIKQSAAQRREASKQKIASGVQKVKKPVKRVGGYLKKEYQAGVEKARQK